MRRSRPAPARAARPLAGGCRNVLRCGAGLGRGRGGLRPVRGRRARLGGARARRLARRCAGPAPAARRHEGRRRVGVTQAGSSQTRRWPCSRSSASPPSRSSPSRPTTRSRRRRTGDGRRRGDLAAMAARGDRRGQALTRPGRPGPDAARARRAASRRSRAAGERDTLHLVDPGSAGGVAASGTHTLVERDVARERQRPILHIDTAAIVLWPVAVVEGDRGDVLRGVRRPTAQGEQQVLAEVCADLFLLRVRAGRLQRAPVGGLELLEARARADPAAVLWSRFQVVTMLLRLVSGSK